MNISKDSFDMFDEQEEYFMECILPEDSKKHYHFDLTLTTQLCSDQSQLSQGYLSKPQSYKLITVVCSLIFLVTKWLFPENTIQGS